MPPVTKLPKEPANLVFDIETGPADDDELMQFVPEFEAPSNYKDPAKIAEAIEAKRQAWIERAALSPLTGRVLAIGLFGDGVPCMLIAGRDGEERDLIEAFWFCIGSFTRVIGFNSHRFDLPFLVRRSWALGVQVPDGFAGRYFRNSVDLMETWQCGDRGETISLDKLARYLRVGAKHGDGALFAETLASDPEAAEAYLRNDLELTSRVACKLGVLTPPLEVPDREPAWAPPADDGDY